MNSSSLLLRHLNAIVLLLVFSLGAFAVAEDKDPICGKWKWFTGEVHRFGPNGQIVGEKGCYWKRIEGTTPPRYIVTWRADFVDTLRLVKDGTELRGKNQTKKRIEGEGDLFGTRITK